jgi:hypothetical protein
MVATADRLDQGGLVAGTTDRPALLAGLRTDPDGSRDLQISAWDGTGWQPSDVGPGVPGEPQDVEIAGSASVTALGGWTWEAGTVWPYLLTSTDRRTWTPVQLPASLNGARVEAVATDGGRVVALTQDDTGAAATVVVDPVDAGTPTVAVLPLPPEGERRRVGAIAVAGDTFVVTGSQGPTEVNAPMVFRSQDAGRTWAEPRAISPNPEAASWGIVHFPGGFLVTGNDLIPGDPDRSLQATAWYSPDGAAWTAETPPEPNAFRWKGHSSALGSPTAAGDYVLAVGGSSSSRSSRPFQRQPSGEWIAVAETDEVADAVGRLGRVAPIVEPDGSQAAGTFVSIGGAHGVVVGQLRSGVWTTTIAPTISRDPPYFSELVAGGAPWRAVIRQRQFLPFGNGGFRTVNEPTVIGLTADALTVLPWDPPQAGDWDDVKIASSAGAELVLAERLTENEESDVLGGWFRAAPGQPWQPVTGFGKQRLENLGELARFGDRWLLSGTRSDDVAGSESQAMIWTSSDGVNWTRAEGDYADADRSSTIGDLCPGPAGEPVAVGWFHLTAVTPTGAVWTEDDGRWQRSILPAGPGTRTWFSSCTTINGKLVVEGALSGNDQRWTIDAGGTFEPAAEPTVDAQLPARHGFGEPFELSEIRPVPGGFAATGRLDTSAHAGPVVWLSADGARWSWVPVPTAQPSSSLTAGADGPDLIVLAGGTNISQAWRIPDTASVIAAIPASA